MYDPPINVITQFRGAIPIHHNSGATGADQITSERLRLADPSRTNASSCASTSRILILALICHQKREINLFSPFTTEILLSFRIRHEFIMQMNGNDGFAVWNRRLSLKNACMHKFGFVIHIRY